MSDRSNDPCPSCPTLEAEIDVYAELIASISAAVLGQLQPMHPYPRKPIRFVEEALCLNRALYRACRAWEEAVANGRYDVTDDDVTVRMKQALRWASDELEAIRPVPAEPGQKGVEG